MNSNFTEKWESTAIVTYSAYGIYESKWIHFASKIHSNETIFVAKSVFLFFGYFNSISLHTKRTLTHTHRKSNKINKEERVEKWRKKSIWVLVTAYQVLWPDDFNHWTVSCLYFTQFYTYYCVYELWTITNSWAVWRHLKSDWEWEKGVKH